MTFDNVLVVKIGGGEGLDLPRTLDDLASIAQQRPVVIVHGVSARMDQMCADRGVPVRTLESPGGHSSRYTDPETRDIFVAAARSVNDDIVQWLATHNLSLAPLTGDDQVILQGERKKALRAVVDGRVKIIRDDYSGSISGVQGARLREIVSQGSIPIVPPMASSDDGLLNVDGDRASAAIAAALQADSLVILSNVRGLYRNWPDESSLVAQVGRNQLEQAMNWAEGRMKRKVLGAQEALEGGVQRVIISDGRIEQPVSAALHGAGTTFTN